MPGLVLDGHCHCGLSLPFETVALEWRRAGIRGGAVFSPVEEIYDRYDPFFRDSEDYVQSRDEVHGYLERLSERDHIFPYFFVWNDFASIPERFVGIKWHRHAGEPVYAYGTSKCEAAIETICARRLPVVLEEEFANTLNFIGKIAGRTQIVIPHLGALNGGYMRLKDAGVFEHANVWVDTALAGQWEIEDFAASYGIDRIVFGSDFPFGLPALEKRKIFGVFSGEDLAAVLAGNLLRLIGMQ